MCHVPLDLTKPGALLKKQSPTKAFTMCLQHSSDPRALSVCQYTEPTDTAAMPASAQHSGPALSAMLQHQVTWACWRGGSSSPPGVDSASARACAARPTCIHKKLMLCPEWLLV